MYFGDCPPQLYRGGRVWSGFNAGTPVLVGGARLNNIRIAATPALYACGLAAFSLLFGSRGLQTAIAEGDTRTISLHHTHTDENITITFKRDGRYDEAALEKLNWFLRDWRRQQQTRMDPHLIDLIWEAQREAGSHEPVWVVCGYRSPETNAMLRRRSEGVAKIQPADVRPRDDLYIPGVPLDQLRAIGLRLQRGGVGFYPTSGSPFVHLDTGSVRHWPRMTREQLSRVFLTAAPCMSRPMAARLPATRWRSTISESAATVRRQRRSPPRATPAWILPTRTLPRNS